jgi:UDP-3-O-[3-hydroxymyristoyl] glucosamine N-acyltransferase
MRYTAGEIARALDAQLHGDAELRIARPAEPADAGPDDLALAMDPKYAEDLSRGLARAALVWEGADWRDLGLDVAIVVRRPRLALAGVTRLMDAGPGIAPGVHPSAVIDAEAALGAGAAIGPLAVIGPGARIGRGARIGPHAYVAPGAVIGDDALIGAGVRIMPKVRIGDRFVVHPNAVIGADGFSFVTPEKSGVERVRETLGDAGDFLAQSWTRIHSLGGVEIGSDVELGACSCIDAGTIRPTRVGDGTKFDDLVMIGHNAEIGRDCLFAGQSGVAGSTRIGDRVVFGGQAAANDNIFIGDDVIVGGGSKIISNVPAGRVLIGYPAQKMEHFVSGMRNVRRLGRLMAQVADLQKAVSKLGGEAYIGGRSRENDDG